MARLTDAVALVYSRFWNAPQDMMPFGQVWAAVRDVYMGMKRDLLLSDVEYFTETFDFYIKGSRDLRMPVPVDGFGYPVRLEYVINGYPTGDLQITSVHNLHAERAVGRMAVAFYGIGKRGAPEMEFSLYTRYLIRLHYERDVELYPETESTVEFRDLFVNYLALKTAVNLLPFYNPPNTDKQLLVALMTKELGEWERSWTHQVNMQPGRGAKRIRPAAVTFQTRRGRRNGWGQGGWR